MPKSLMPKNMGRQLVKLGRQNASLDDDDDDDQPRVPFQVFSQSVTIQNYDIYLSDVVGDPAAYDPLCNLLRSLSEHDSVKFFINTPGGDLSAGMAIVQAMQDSAATITTVLHPRGYSMGALLFLAGDVMEVPPNCQLMLHHYSSALHGKGNEQAAQVTAAVAWYGDIVRDICTGFLSPEEVESMLQGKDFWMQSDEIQVRIENMMVEQPLEGVSD